ncbi:MAG: hypothetical protein KDA85_20145, partial [Planctomycetaceae bacterium]|nr:hypothetical protein [Planctomycetaceae bacterium]
LNAWIDFNNNGVFTDSGEQITANTIIAAGTSNASRNINVVVPAQAVTGTPVGVRVRLSATSSPGSTGAGGAGEVEDYVADIAPPTTDYGDLSLFSDASSTVVDGLRLGSLVDTEYNPTKNAAATGDDITELDDEDAVTFPTLIAGALATIPVTVTNTTGAPAYLNAWIDFNNNGSWNDAGEQIFTSQAVSAGDNDFTINIPDGLTAVTAAAVRFRISSSGGLAPTGTAGDGEVEDLTVGIIGPKRLEITLDAATVYENAGTLSGTITRVSADTTQPLDVIVTSTDTTEATVPVIITIPANQSSVAFSVTIVDDTLLDGDIPVTLTAIPQTVGIANGTANLTVLDYETITATVSHSFVAETTGLGVVTLTLTRSNKDNSSDLFVTLSSSDLTEATVPASVTIPGGSDSATVDVTVVDDLLQDGDILVQLSGGAPGYISIADDMTVRDNESAGITLTTAVPGAITDETGATTDVTVVLDTAPIDDVFVQLSVSDPTEGSIVVGQLQFTSTDWYLPQTVTITGQDDPLVDGDQVFQLRAVVNTALSDVIYANVTASVDVTNLDNESAGFVVIESDGNTDVTEGGATDQLTIHLLNQPLTDVFLSITVSDPADFATNPTQLRFTNGNWNLDQTVTISAVDDFLLDGLTAGTITISVIDATSDDHFDTLSDQIINLSVHDNDIAGFVVTESQGTTVVSESGTTDSITVRLNAQPISDVVLNLFISDPGEASISTNRLVFTNATWSQLQTVTVTGVDDLIFDGTQHALLSLSVSVAESDSAFASVAPQSIDVSVNDDEPLPPQLLLPAFRTDSDYPVIGWTPVPGAASYEVWVNNATTLTGRVIHETGVTTTSLTSPNQLALGRHIAWVRAFMPSGFVTPWSNPLVFNVQTPPVHVPVARYLDSPQPTFEWTPPLNAATYDVWIDDRLNSISGLIRENGLTSTSWQVSAALPMGLYRFWVRARSPEGFVSNWSRGIEFNIATAPQPLTPSLPTFDRTPTFTWSSVARARIYRVMVQDLTTRQIVIDQSMIELRQFTPTQPLADGPHRWWVQAMSDHNVQGLWSSPVDFNPGGRPTVLTPVGQGQSTTPTFTWTAVTGAFRYNIYVLRLDQPGVPIQQNFIQGNSYTSTVQLVSGASYRVWVRA